MLLLASLLPGTASQDSRQVGRDVRLRSHDAAYGEASGPWLRIIRRFLTLAFSEVVRQQCFMNHSVGGCAWYRSLATVVALRRADELPYVLSEDGSGLLPFSSPLLIWTAPVCVRPPSPAGAERRATKQRVKRRSSPGGVPSMRSGSRVASFPRPFLAGGNATNDGPQGTRLHQLPHEREVQPSFQTPVEVVFGGRVLKPGVAG
jgi:hypothetical protein